MARPILSAGPVRRLPGRKGEVRRLPQELIDLDRRRKVSVREFARKPAPMLDPDRVTVKGRRPEYVSLRDNDSRAPSMIEWE